MIFCEEMVFDLFGEQVVLVGGMVVLVKVSFECLVVAGVLECMVYIDCVYEIKYLVDFIQLCGIVGMYKVILDMVEFGVCEIEDWIVGFELCKVFDDVMVDIESDCFVCKWVEIYEVGEVMVVDCEVDELFDIEEVGCDLCLCFYGVLKQLRCMISCNRYMILEWIVGVGNGI